MKTNHPIRRIAFIGNYLPRHCGIATFTTDLCEAISHQYPEIECLALAVNDRPESYDYPSRVRFEIVQDDLNSYKSAADFLNMMNVDLVCLQHEYGIYGGKAGSHILSLLAGLRMPVITTLHTILTDPEPAQRKVMDELIQLSDRLVVMSQRGVDYLEKIYAASAEKIDLIPHGIPDVPFIDPNFYKDQFDVEGKRVLLTFGLLSPNKGIEYVINALPSILARYPNVVYLVLGATHPHVVKSSGEEYRNSLTDLAVKLGVEKNVRFFDQFVSLEELVEFIGVADIYITPYLSKTQIVSGTLAYTLGAGKAVISTPYWYAEELLDNERGRLVPFKDSKAIADEVLSLLDNEASLHQMRKRGYLYGREMIWKQVSQRYFESFSVAREARVHQPSSILVPRSAFQADKMTGGLPALNLNHLLRLSDNTGILQHATYHLPNYSEGYTTDDNARALILVNILNKLGGSYFVDVDALAARYMAFIYYAYNPDKNRFRNFLDFNRCWLEEVGSEDSHGRALWSLGSVLSNSNDEGLKSAAARLVSRVMKSTLELKSPRSWAFSLLGICEYLRSFSGDRAVFHAGKDLAERLMALYRNNRGEGWYWFENNVTYNNATLPHALLRSSIWLDRPDYADVALESLRWLADIQTNEKGYFSPIGNAGFYPRGGEKAHFDQQPIEASAMVSACVEAYQLTGDRSWYQEAQRAFNWFMGQNDLGVPIYNPETGGCFDGLHPDRVNQNQGAESTLAFLMALLEMRYQNHLDLSKVSDQKEMTTSLQNKETTSR